MGKAIKCQKFPLYCFFGFFLLYIFIGSAFAKTVNISVTPFSGVAPLEVQIICGVATNTSAPQSYKMDFGDGSDPITVETNKYTHIFTHTYEKGFYQPVCSVSKTLGSVSSSDPGKVVVAKWKFKTNGETDSSPAIGPDGTVYAGSDDGNLYAINPDTGEEKWRFLTTGAIQSSPAVGPDGTIYIGSLDKNIYALKSSGALMWSYNIGDFIFSSPALNSDGTVIFIGASDNNIYAINASSGTLKWKVGTAGKIISSPVMGYDGIEDVIYVGSLDHHVYALAAGNGNVKWTFETNTEVYGSPAVGADGKIYVGECRTGDAVDYNFKLFCINVDGSKSWDFDGGTGFYSSPAIDPDGLIYIGSWDGTFYALKPDGTKNWSLTTSPPRSINSSPAIGISNGYPVLYVGAKDGNFYAFQSPAVQNDLNALTRQDWVFQTGDDIWYSSPAIDQNGTIYFGSHDKCIYAVNPGNMKIADTRWSMFHNKANHSGVAGTIQIPTVISTSPSTNSTTISVNTGQVQINFSPAMTDSSLVQIDSFQLQNQTDNNAVQGQALTQYNRYNNTAYNLSAVLNLKSSELPLKYNTTYSASISYQDPQNAANSSETQPQFTTYSWNFTTEADPTTPNPSPRTDWSCFINTIYLQ